ncbi:hypothetical protein [Floridanema evergladense]|uniref:Na+-transporting NADH:ubiquinone oxidoreductase, subunit NqrB n=1 Tax=Floridaenema evergladense BLCC-F167 TaxID=3153639 RepID=A0ABV4WDT2_9CYAN
MLLKDIRDYQILFLSLFLILGISNRDWTLRPATILVVILTCLITQWLAELAISQETRIKATISNPEKFTSLRSAAITALSLCLLLRSEHYETMILAASLAILSKFLLQFRHKHFFNPANFGIIVAITFTNDAWVSPGQWGEDWLYIPIRFS